VTKDYHGVLTFRPTTYSTETIVEPTKLNCKCDKTVTCESCKQSQYVHCDMYTTISGKLVLVFKCKFCNGINYELA
jgi:hypothetical protein